jgi:hypothetical protein
MSKIFLGQPCYGSIEMESADAVDKALSAESPHDELRIERKSSSLLANCFNTLLGTCLQYNREQPDGYEYFLLLHADVSPTGMCGAHVGWLDTLIAELEQYNLDVIHAPCLVKDGKDLTSTAIAYSDDPWEPVRRIAHKELEKLWPTFTVGMLREQLNVPEAYALLPNTGCMLIKLGGWLTKFPGFEIRDRLVFAPSPGHSEPHWQAWTVSEDWNFGFWCAANGVKVGATTKVKPVHFGRCPFILEKPFGQERDETFFELRAAAAKAA